jgi:hypothetical protein
MISFLSSAVPFLTPYPIWIKLIVAFWIVLTAIMLICLLFGRTSKLQTEAKNVPEIKQKVSVDKISDGNVYQAGGDININTESSDIAIDSIQSISIEVRLTCDLKEGAEIPPAEVRFMPIGDSDSYFKGPPGARRLEFKSPVRFRRQDPNKIMVINRFSLDSGSELLHNPLAVLKNYEILSVPVITVVYGKSLQKFTLLEVVLTVNGEDIWYGSYKYDVPFQVGPRFEVPLVELHKKL